MSEFGIIAIIAFGCLLILAIIGAIRDIRIQNHIFDELVKASKEEMIKNENNTSKNN